MHGRHVLLGQTLLSFALLLPLSSSANAADVKASRPAIAPAPDWVLPAAIPAVPRGAEGAATVELLTDSQLRLTKDGDSKYFADAFKIASAQGLDDAALQVSWDPAIETLTLHRYSILRDGKEIDLLGDGSKLSVIQRETNMERAALDGELTASLQPDDLRVGDIVEIAFTRTRRDPAMGGRSEALFGPEDGQLYGHLRFRVLWPDDKTMNWRAFPGVLHPKLTHSSSGNELIADLTEVTTARPPKGAPSRFMLVNAIDMSEFADWGAVARAMLPFYGAAGKLDPNSPLHAEAKRIAAAWSDPARRAEMALALVQDQVRYLFLGMDDGGYIPASADLTWARRFGDCKAKTVLLIALLKELGIAAEPVLVNTDHGDLVSARLPAMGVFDHVLVRARIGKRSYWLDGTRLGDTSLARLRTPAYFVGLPIAADTRALIKLDPEPLDQPSETVSLALDASAGIDAPAPAKGEMRFRMDSATEMRMKYAGLSAQERDRELRELWRKNFDFVSPSAITTATDEKSGEFVISMSGTAKMDWYSEADTRWYEVDRARLGWKLDIDREGTIGKDAPFEVDYPDFWESRETIKLPPVPPSATPFRLQGGPVDKVIGGTYAFHRKVDISNGVLTMESSTRTLAPELPADKAEQTQSEMTALSNNGVYVRVPDDYMATAGDIAALQGNKSALVDALVHRGAVHFDRGELPASIADEDAALAVKSDTASALAVRALALAAQGDVRADDSADRAIALDAKQQLAWRAKGVLALSQKRYADAEADFSKQLALAPHDDRGLTGRGTARIMLAKFAEALADINAAMAINPDLPLRPLRATALGGAGRTAEALAEADRAVAEQPKSEKMLAFRASLREEVGRFDLAREDYGQLISQTSKVVYYLDRAALWPVADHARRDGDIEAALRIDPRSTRAMAMRASAAIEDGNFASAEQDIAAIAQADRNNRSIDELRLKMLEKQGKKSESLQFVDALVAKHPNDASALNERCWTKATMNVDLQNAIKDCNESLRLKPDDPGTLDSRAFANLRLGATDAALADYNDALRRVPALSASLFGRAIARARKGDAAGARSDLAEARRLSPEIVVRFAGYGISLPASLQAVDSTQATQPN